jgi:hypothetical protein
MAQLLRFFARADQLVPFPGFSPGAGQAALYVGRTFDAGIGGYPATRDAAEFEPGSPAAQRLLKVARRDASLWPADQFTAQACELPFVELEFNSGEYVAKAPPVAAPSRKGSDS